MSGANRLPNGNTLICESVDGTIFEVTPKKETVWKYVNPAERLLLLGHARRPADGRPADGRPADAR